jgi:Plant transposon protein
MRNGGAPYNNSNSIVHISHSSSAGVVVSSAVAMDIEEDDEYMQKSVECRKRLLLLALGAVAIAAQEQEQQDDGEGPDIFWANDVVDHRSNPRGRRRVFDSQGAYDNIMRDHLGPDPLFGADVLLFFRMSRERIEVIIQSLGNSGNSFYGTFRSDRHGKRGASIEAKVLIAIRTLAYGVASYCFCDYFSMSKTSALDCCRMFNKNIPKIFGDEYMRVPTAADLGAVVALHKRVHGVDGMLGSLDCMHTYWKNCPVAWQQSFKGKQSGPTIVLEAVADHCLWFWHTSYGYSGAMNDLNILNQSPLLRKMTDGSFSATEREALVVPFSIIGRQFDKMFMLVDGIYPKYSRFVRGYKAPILPEEKRFTKWQEGARKDIERAFGVLQAKWKAVANPIHLIDLKAIANMMATCIVLHNMCVSDRVMGDVHARYRPSSGVAQEKASDVEDLPTAQVPPPPTGVHVVPAATGIDSFDARLARTIADREEWKALKNHEEWSRLQAALIQFKGSSGNSNH